MPITNQPITPNRSLGMGKKLLGFFPPYLVPGLLGGLVVTAIATEVIKDDKIKPALAGGAVVAVYWLYAGKGEEEAWSNFGRLLPIPVLHMPDDLNKDTLIETPQAVTKKKSQKRPAAKPQNKEVANATRRRQAV
jgi:hypothetical protein